MDSARSVWRGQQGVTDLLSCVFIFPPCYSLRPVLYLLLLHTPPLSPSLLPWSPLPQWWSQWSMHYTKQLTILQWESFQQPKQFFLSINMPSRQSSFLIEVESYDCHTTTWCSHWKCVLGWLAVCFNITEMWPSISEFSTSSEHHTSIPLSFCVWVQWMWVDTFIIRKRTTTLCPHRPTQTHTLHTALHHCHIKRSSRYHWYDSCHSCI